MTINTSSTPLCCLWGHLSGHGISSCWSPQVTACNFTNGPWSQSTIICAINLCRRVKCVAPPSCPLFPHNPLVAPKAHNLEGIWEAWSKPSWQTHRMGWYILRMSIYRGTDSFCCQVDKIWDKLHFSEPQPSLWCAPGIAQFLGLQPGWDRGLQTNKLCHIATQLKDKLLKPRLPRLQYLKWYSSHFWVLHK